MNERNLYDDEFEKLLKEKADQFKMYPSDKVWNEVNSALHSNRRRFVAGMTLLIGGFLILAATQLVSPSLHSRQNLAATKSVITGKPAPTTDLPVSAANKFVSLLPGTAAGTGNPDQDLNSNSPFALTTLGTTESGSRSTEFLTAHPDETAGRITSVSSSYEDLFIKPVSALVVPALPETQSPAVHIAQSNMTSALLAPENSVTHLGPSRNERLSWEIYMTPTLNKRYLSGMNAQNFQQSLQNAPIMVVRVTNVNGFIDNTPVMGYDVGGNLVYKLSKNISLKAGVEFSYSRYYIKAYNSSPSQFNVTLSPYLGNIPDSLGNMNPGGNGLSLDKNPQRIQNKYYQLSLPVGIEMKVAGSGKVQLHLGVTMQPSYLLNTDSYILSGDYNSYVKDPTAFRRWNLNAGGEVYISYRVGKIQWELGPEVRYQIFSTYKNTYPLNENLLNYGIRIGFSKTIW
jgi:hypothetical protein